MSMSPRLLRPRESFTPKSISGLALWLDASDTSSLYTTDAGAVTAVTAPTDISGCVLWLDGADSSSASMTLNGSLVETWKDKSGSNNNATAAGTARPTLTSGGLNGKSVVTFDGTANAMQIAANAAFNSNNLTYFVVFRQDTAANKGVYTKLNSTAGTSGFGLAVRSDASIWLLQKNAGTPQVLYIAANPTTQARIYTVTSSSTAAGYLDGLLSVNVASTADHSLVQRVMVGSRDSSEYLNGYVAEVIHYNRVLTRSELAQVEAMLAAKWGVSGVHAPATTAGDPVGYWADKSNNNRHATQSTAASRPTVSATALNGKKQLALVSQHLRGPASTWSGSASIYWVGKTGQASSGAIVFSDGAVDQTDGFHAGWLYQQGVGAYGNGWNAGNAPRAESPTAWRNADIVAGVTLSSTESVARVNGATTNTVSALTGSLSQASAAQFYVGREASNVWNNLNGSIAELLIYQPALNASQRQRLERYLAAKYGITLAPQVSDPDAQDWVNRVYAAGSTVSQAAAAAVNTFVVGCKDDGIWTAMRKVLLLIGVDTFAGCAAHLKGTAPTFTNFSSANYSRTAGLQGVNTGYIRAAMRVSDLTASNSMHLAAWQTAANTAVATTFLANGQGGGGYLRDNVTNTGIRANSVEVLTINSRGSAGTMIGMSRNSTTQYGIVNGTVTSGASAVNDTGTTTEYDLMGAGTGSSYLGRVSFFSFGDGIDLATLNARVSTLMSTLGSL